MFQEFSDLDEYKDMPKYCGNILKFRLHKGKIIFDWNKYGQNLYCNKSNLIAGKEYIKCKYDISKRIQCNFCNKECQHNIELKIKTLIIFFEIPPFLLENNTMKKELLDNDANIIRKDETEFCFKKWEYDNCCNIDIYEVSGIEYCRII